MHIRPSESSSLSIHMITEGGIIGKIGLNSHGVGVTLNAIKCAGVNFNKIPCHLALRTALSSTSRDEAIARIGKFGVASACHILVADATGGTGLECSANDIVHLNMDHEVEPCPGVVTHTNHFVHQHENAASKPYLADSVPRLNRVRELIKSANSMPSVETISKILRDENGYPTAICRTPTEQSPMASLFSIVMDLKETTATVQVGKPTKPSGTIELQP